ncbi:xyloglucan endotransglucosylase/hydrolase protein 3-like isoform X1 [Salvia miltiorrhiza]|uniref:xyloglucan endotransglucosylase/hydrolase protein 3-like isoform X1 n=1 Tax=Salvia miltiorrhiza TaxID=226208 RepID=UPI0025AB74C7|nr:xyloglucan endotransglucosylase/hydrolase protein 3-like isoform X1 [Salvia miltiorrhiza]
MGSCKFTFLALLYVFGSTVDAAFRDVPFDDIYDVVWGGDHVMFLNERRDAQLWMDPNSGAGFGSKLNYGSGFFHMRIKLPNKDSAGVVTAFYLTSNSSKHDEIDFEFLGNREGKPITLQTNVFAEGMGDREQRTLLWFDPTADFHTYKLLWNLHQIVFYVDNIPIRVFRNKQDIGVPYPNQPMRIQVSLWNGEDWATDGGKTKIDWSHAPFVAHFQGFGFGACPVPKNTIDVEGCYDSKYWWNGSKYWKLSGKEQRLFEEVRDKYMNYDYCNDTNRHATTPPECEFNK